MSCENPATDKDALMTPRTKFDKSRICVKCKLNLGNIIIRHAVYCKECFFPLISARFRKSLEPSVNPIPDGPRKKGLKAAGNLLLGFSGGLGSTVLIDLVWRSYFERMEAEAQEEEKRNKHGERGEEEKEKKEQRGGKDHPRKAKVWKKTMVCYIETCGAFPGMKDRTEQTRSVLDRYKSFEFMPLRLEDAFDESWWVSVGGRPKAGHLGIDITNEELFLSPSPSSTTTPNNPLTALRTYISSLPTQTAIPSAVHTLTRLLLLHTAAAQGCSHLLLGTSLTSLSVSLIAGISQGGGFSVREEAQEEWVPIRRSGGEEKAKEQLNVRIIRPLREVGIKECAIWAWWMELKVVGRERYAGGRQGIGALTRDFIMGLERDYPSTVSTIARTCAKLAPKEGSDGVCILCERPAQHGVQEWKSRISIRSYKDAGVSPPHLASSSRSATSAPILPSFSQTNHTTSSQITDSLTPYLCYACHTTLTSRSSRGTAGSSLTNGKSINESDKENVPLPVWVTAGIRDKSDSKRMPMGDGEEDEEQIEGERWRTTRMDEGAMKGVIGEFLLDE
ncbi:hypothetical protein BDQ12DRAFT_711752 [Crucibulum laeve]|uniref:Cytoplasmic tRNA 2-thiolation protein 2 n=1 Tax=Crucibulum laeve TaxID=68775 RepID=A0A5C3M6X1_9AGAR|nr:hypothetical protein BDQ12DRAFT_711752 [Crucibulum laeve]